MERNLLACRQFDWTGAVTKICQHVPNLARTADVPIRHLGCQCQVTVPPVSRSGDSDIRKYKIQGVPWGRTAISYINKHKIVYDVV